MKKYIFGAIIITFGILSFSAQASSVSVSLKKDSNGFFTVTIKNSNGIKAFALTAPQKLPYGGEIGGCPTSKIITNVVFADPDDFTPALDASVTDCQDNIQTLKISAPKNGITSAVSETAQEVPAEQAISSTQTAESSASASALNDIKYPISELGNCSSKDSCKKYCDDSQNSDACLAFAGQHNLMSSNEVSVAKKFIDSGMAGPGSCKGQAECDQYCGISDHMEACITFAQKNGLISGQKLQESQKVLTAIKKGIKPPACGGPKQCETYCSSAEHMEECMNFSLAAGLVPDNQKAQMQKTLTVLKQGIKPPACRPNPPSQSEQFGRPSQQNKTDQSGQGLQACDQYCSDSSHIEECVKFSVAVGNMTEQQAQMTIKTGGKGPGGCVGKDACDTFCNNPDNQDTCFNFAKDNGMISEDQLQQMQGGQQKMKDSFSSIPPEVLDCLNSSVGADVVEKMKTGSVNQRSIGDAINQCFQKFGIREGTPNGNGPGSGQGGQLDQNQNGQGQQNQQDQSGQGGGGGEQDGLGCGIVTGTVAEYVCAINGNSRGASTGSGVETTYFNECHAKQQGAQILHSGVCVRNGEPDVPCSAIADPVCGTDGNSWVNECNAKEAGAGVKYAGACKSQPNQSGQSGQNQNGQGQQNQQRQNQQRQQQNQSGQNQPGPGGINSGGQQMPQQAGPGGCKGPEECQKYCTSNPEVCKNFKPQQNQQGQGGPGQGGPNQGQGFNSGSGQNGNSQFNQSGQQGQMQPKGQQQQFQGGQSGQSGQFNQPNQLNQPNQINQQGQYGQPQQGMQPQQDQQPQQQMQYQQQPQYPDGQQNPPPPPTSFLQQAQKLLGNPLNIFK